MGKYDDTMAKITRQQYEDYQSRFLPSEQRLLSLASSDELLNNQLQRNVENVDQSFESAQQAEAMRGSRYGLSDKTTGQQTTNTGLDKALATASVQNETRQAVGDIKNNIITGSASDPKQQLSKIGEGSY